MTVPLVIPEWLVAILTILTIILGSGGLVRVI